MINRSTYYKIYLYNPTLNIIFTLLVHVHMYIRFIHIRLTIPSIMQSHDIHYIHIHTYIHTKVHTVHVPLPHTYMYDVYVMYCIIHYTHTVGTLMIHVVLLFLLFIVVTLF